MITNFKIQVLMSLIWRTLWLDRVLNAYLRRHAPHLLKDSTDFVKRMGNVKLNYEFRQLDQVTDVYVFPQMGDGGLALGGAMAAELEEGGGRRVPMRTAYHGPSFDDAEVEVAVEHLGGRVLELMRLRGRGGGQPIGA